MKSTSILCAFALSLFVVLDGGAQDRPAVGRSEGPTAARPADPRIGLKAGLRDAGEAASNLERIASLPKPDGFFDPKAPGGNPSPPEPAPNAPGGAPAAAGAAPAQSGGTPTPPPFDPVASNRLGFTNSDLAFSGNHVIVGNYHGFNTYDVERPNRPKLLASVVCPRSEERRVGKECRS